MFVGLFVSSWWWGRGCSKVYYLCFAGGEDVFCLNVLLCAVCFFVYDYVEGSFDRLS